MRRTGLLAATLGFAASPAASVAIARTVLTSPRPAYWRPGGVTPGGNVWHAGGPAAWGGACRSGWPHGYADSGWARAGWARPVPVAGGYHPAGTAVGAATVVGGLAGTAASAYHYPNAQPPTVVNNYYGY